MKKKLFLSFTSRLTFVHTFQSGDTGNSRYGSRYQPRSRSPIIQPVLLYQAQRTRDRPHLYPWRTDQTRMYFLSAYMAWRSDTFPHPLSSQRPHDSARLTARSGFNDRTIQPQRPHEWTGICRAILSVTISSQLRNLHVTQQGYFCSVKKYFKTWKKV